VWPRFETCDRVPKKNTLKTTQKRKRCREQPSTHIHDTV
jgi:hypothetical protein